MNCKTWYVEKSDKKQEINELERKETEARWDCSIVQNITSLFLIN